MDFYDKLSNCIFSCSLNGYTDLPACVDYRGGKRYVGVAIYMRTNDRVF